VQVKNKDSDPVNDPTQAADPIVRHFRQILLWPLRVIPGQAGGIHISKYWELLEALGDDCPWREVADEFADPSDFQERHYKEFVTFLPYVQRFLYGEGVGREGLTGYGKSPIRVFRRSGIAQMRAIFDDQSPPVVFQIAHIDLHFFYDIDIIILAVEFFTNDLPLSLAQEALFKLGRAYPAFWEANGQGGQCPRRVEWLSATGKRWRCPTTKTGIKYSVRLPAPLAQCRRALGISVAAPGFVPFR
jgi:hypothetical protein